MANHLKRYVSITVLICLTIVAIATPSGAVYVVNDDPGAYKQKPSLHKCLPHRGSSETGNRSDTKGTREISKPRKTPTTIATRTPKNGKKKGSDAGSTKACDPQGTSWFHVAGVITLVCLFPILVTVTLLIFNRRRLRNLMKSNHAEPRDDTPDPNYETPNSPPRLPIIPTSKFIEVTIGNGTKPKLHRSSLRIAGTVDESIPMSSRELEASDVGQFKSWSNANNGWHSGSIWSEKVRGKGEDATPFLLINGRESAVAAAVLDGLGGSGSALLTFTDNSEATQAWEASRLARSIIESLFVRRVDLLKSSLEVADSLAAEIKRLFDVRVQEIQEVGQYKSSLASSLTRSLPTTLAGFTMNDKRALATVFWAGDSRVYCLTAASGLQVLTTDDCAPMDAFESLAKDPPLTNVICADRGFEIHQRELTIERPAVLIAATDGCFNYWPTPANFEFEILQAIVASSNWDEAIVAIGQSITSVANDDTSLVIHAFGYERFADLRQEFVRRYEEIKSFALDPLVELRAKNGSRDDYEAYRLEAWMKYKHSYEALLEHEVEE